MQRYIKFIAIELILLICAGCNNKNIINDDYKSDYYSQTSCETKYEPEQRIEFDITPELDSPKELLPTPFNRTIEEIDSEWSEDDISIAWNMIEASNVYAEYTDRLFCNVYGDSSNELLLTSYSTKNMYFFKKTDNKVEMIYDYLDMDITNGNMIIPPTDKDIIQQCEAYDYQKYHAFKLYNMNGDLYITGISFRPAIGKTCWIKKLITSADGIAFYDVFRWGMFTKNERIASEFEYRRYDCTENYSNSTQQEIAEFLSFLDSDISDDSKVTNETSVFSSESQYSVITE